MKKLAGLGVLAPVGVHVAIDQQHRAVCHVARIAFQDHNVVGTRSPVFRMLSIPKGELTYLPPPVYKQA